ncbi:DNA-directed RNA polymerase I subunit RPA49 [Hibiscus syriacus]|uniref:protein-serine/threonine phosphatase n=1 Tax=Hibiscus syriacus TaxID=106335 RepID=A0A6A2XCV1_HIBSY|nr:DNA-directed RNA polymerase I subunit RPA49 [Hibiscus syriacus]
MCENSGITAHVEIAALKLVTDSANLLSDSAKVNSQESISSSYGNCEDVKNGFNVVAMSEGVGEEADLSKMIHKNRNRSIAASELMAQESEEDEIFLVDTNGIVNEGLLVPTAEAILTTVSSDAKISDGIDFKASKVIIQLLSEKNLNRGSWSVFELDCIPLWGSASIIGKRTEMEDAVAAMPWFIKIPIKMLFRDRVFDGISKNLTDLTGHFFGVYDGHGGSQIGGKVSRGNGDVSDASFESIAPETVGSTAVVALPNREDQYARIEASGGKVIQWKGHRVFGVLAMSRSLGDRYLKPWIIPEPEVTFIPRAREHECLILASDGLWDVISNEEACVVARRRILLWHKKNVVLSLVERGKGIDPAAQAAAEYLSMLAIQSGSGDNICNCCRLESSKEVQEQIIIPFSALNHRKINSL